MSAGPTPRQPVSLSTFDTTPLFMREAAVGTDRDAPEDDQNTLAALQSLIHEGDPEEVASNFKDQGNGYFKARRFREAMGFYTQGVEALTIQSIDGSPKTVENSKENFGKVLKDVKLVLETDPRSSKALFRAAKALVKLRRYEEALDACDRCLSFDPDNGGVKSIQVIAQKELNVEVNKARQKAEAEEKEKAKKAALSLALQHHGITVLKDNTDPEHLPFLDPPTPPYPTSAQLICRVVLVYPQYGQTDLIVRFSTEDTLGAHLDSILPDPETGSDVPFAPWDEKQEYISNKVNVYVKLEREEYCDCEGEGREDDGLVIGQGVVAFVVVPKGSLAEEKYLKSVKEERKDKA
ncbi:TPR-1 domain protein [Rhizoctonia solani]|uniref:TPR-1 domain protein n=1 Tax=Rhizoctonia solani TaxID=456999 RepID=A0A8H8NTM6_9AGAM|nr:TPR-1 domain protein [Rhizoctonia solani]QRW19315.1 TPR-1 domain protein [Rhizoctonia solani]